MPAAARASASVAFVSVAAGPYIHSLNDVSPATGVSSSLTAVMGGRVGAGANWYVTRHVALQLEGDYHAVPGFEATDGVRRSVSGFALSVGAGFAWGGSAPR